MDVMTFDRIHGWFDWLTLYRDVVSAAPAGAVVVEIGSWKGRSAAYMARQIKDSGKSIKFYAVDWWGIAENKVGECSDNFDKFHADYIAGGEPVYETFVSNLEACGVSDAVIPVVCDSARAAERFADGSVYFAFIDASHTREGVRRDVLAWYPKIAPGGGIAGHDYSRPEVADGVADAFRDLGLRVCDLRALEPDPVEVTLQPTCSLSWLYEVPPAADRKDL